MDGSGYSDLLIKQVCFAAPSSQPFDCFAVTIDGNFYERFREILAGNSIVR